MIGIRTFAVMAILMAGLITGCKQKQPEVPDKVIPSLSDAVGQLIHTRNVIRDCFARGDLDAAHGPLHEIGHLLEKLSEAAHGESLPAHKMVIVERTKDTLFEAFDEVDKTFHGGEGKTYDEVAATVDQALAELAVIAGIDYSASSDPGMNEHPEQGAPSDSPLDDDDGLGEAVDADPVDVDPEDTDQDSDQ